MHISSHLQNQDSEAERRIDAYRLSMDRGRGCLYEAPEIASGLFSLRAKALGKVKIYKYFIDFSCPFLFKSPRAGMNRLFEQDPAFPHFGSREDQLAFYSAKIALSEEQKKSGFVPTAGGPIQNESIAAPLEGRPGLVLKMNFNEVQQTVQQR